MKSILAFIVLGFGVLAPASLAASRHKIIGTCALSQSATGDLLVSGDGWGGGTSYQWELYSTLPSFPGAEDAASVGGGQLTADASGAFTADLGPLSFFMNVYQNETTLTFVVYPIVGNKADLTTPLSSCTITP